ncbi:MAG: class I SAM-dependent methyltransferase [Candidatus Kryptoniota bacterium]
MMKLMRRFNDLGIEGAIARWYDNNTRDHRMDEMRAYAKEVMNRIEDGCAILEVAPGPDYLAIELAKAGKYKVTGLDITKDFVEIAIRNAKCAGVAVDFRQGNVSNMPFPNDTFDFIICSAAFKNFKEPLKALREMYRVLNQDGAILIVDLNRNVSNRDINTLTRSMGVKGLEALFMKSTFKYFLRKGAYSRDGFVNLISNTPFDSYDIMEQELTLHVYLQKQLSTIQ